MRLRVVAPLILGIVLLAAGGLSALPSRDSDRSDSGIPVPATEARSTVPLTLPNPAGHTPSTEAPVAHMTAAQASMVSRSVAEASAPDTPAIPEDDPVSLAALVPARSAGQAPGAIEASIPSPEPAATAVPEAAAPATLVPVEPGEALVMKVKRGDSLDRLFRRHGLSTTDLAYIMKLDEAAAHLKTIRPGDRIEVRHEGGSILKLGRTVGELSSLEVTREGDGYRARLAERLPEIRIQRAHGTIMTSLYEAGMQARLSDTTIMNLAGIFAWDVDFALDIREGDGFSVIYEERWLDGKRLKDGNILAAEFHNQGESFRALRFETSAGRAEYFTPEGKSVRKAFLRAPVDFRRVSSNFNMRRLHPVLKVRRPHRGVDYAASTGTPIKAAGDGRIVHRGRKGGYGNTVIIQHGGNITTLYAHMSKYKSGQRVGSRVRQGQVIGYVGKTGLASGPHLHYEYRLNGVHRNPRTVKLPDAEPVDPSLREEFARATGPLVAELDDLKRIRLAAAN